MRSKITALLTGLTLDQIRALSRAERQRLPDQLECVNFLIGDAERSAAGARRKTSVLGGLGDGERLARENAHLLGTEGGSNLSHLGAR